MKGHVYERMTGGYRKHGPYDALGASPKQVVADAYTNATGKPFEVGDRVVIDGQQVYEQNDFGTWELVAAGPAGEGIVSAMEGP